MASMRYRVQSRVQVCLMNQRTRIYDMIGDDEKKSDSAIELAFLLALDGASDAQALYSSRTMTAIAGDSSRGLEYDGCARNMFYIFQLCSPKTMASARPRTLT